MEVVSLEGNIGSGKSFLLKRISKLVNSDKVVLLPEPVDMFQKYKSYNPLKLYYENPSRNAYFVQQHINECLSENFASFAKTHSKCTTLVSERNCYSPILFTSTLFNMGYLLPHEKDKLIDQCMENLAKFKSSYGADKVFYIEAPVEVCFDRVQLRGRPGEQHITREYLSDLEAQYAKYIHAFSAKHGKMSLRIAKYDDPDIDCSLLKFIQNE